MPSARRRGKARMERGALTSVGDIVGGTAGRPAVTIWRPHPAPLRRRASSNPVLGRLGMSGLIETGGLFGRSDLIDDSSVMKI